MILLASKSPRRRDILMDMGIEFAIVPSGYEEQNDRPVPPEILVEAQARGKALDVWHRTGETVPVLGADTVVVLDGQVMGKPSSREEAAAMLQRLSGRVHDVLTGVALAAGGVIESQVCRTSVSFRVLSAEEIRSYIETGEPMDKAGAYAIQGLGRAFVRQIDGSWSNVVGLPRGALKELLGKAGIL